ncbi:hypothetical protein LTR17_008998 [Elasticomyces elasticus]|nr:hypothetical protein LTR17_008998 [Elasticomyces elasticus]
MSIDSRAEPTQAPNIFGSTVELIVGTEAVPLRVHESLLRPHSAFFDAALNKCWKEGNEKIIRLPEEELRIVTKYVQFLYTSKIHIDKTKDWIPRYSSAGIPEHLALAELYVFGERVQDVTFKNATMAAWVARVCEPVTGEKYDFPDNKAIDMIYEGTTSGSLARLFVVGLYVRFAAEHWIPELPEDNNKEFLVDLVRLTLKYRRMGIVWVGGSGDTGAALGRMDFNNYYESGK